MSEDIGKTEMQALKERADLLGVKYSPNIGLETLKERIEEKLTAKEPKPEPTDKPTQQGLKVSTKETEDQRKLRKKREAFKLVRCRVTCMNPMKSAWQGEIFTVSNSLVGTIKKFVPFNNDAGWHVPQMILSMMEDRRFMQHFTEKTSKGVVNRQKMVKEFAIEILPPLTKKELEELAKTQALGRHID